MSDYVINKIKECIEEGVAPFFIAAMYCLTLEQLEKLIDDREDS